MVMGIGKSVVFSGKAANSVQSPNFDKGIGAQARSGLAQASFADRVRACFRHGALASIWTPKSSPKHASVKLRHGALRLELPRGVDPTSRARYEKGIFRLFFGRASLAHHMKAMRNERVFEFQNGAGQRADAGFPFLGIPRG